MQCYKHKKYTEFDVVEIDMSKIQCIICLDDTCKIKCVSINCTHYKKNCKCVYMVHPECFSKWFDQKPKCLFCMEPVINVHIEMKKYTKKAICITLLVCITVLSIYIIISAITVGAIFK
jgi:hypothetical protein